MKREFLEAGRVVNTHGIRGEIKISPWADGPSFLTRFRTLYLDGKPYEAESCRVHKEMVLAKLRGVDTVEAAQALRGKVVTVRHDEAEAPEGSVFIADLIGLPVEADGREIGRIEDVMKMPANDVYVVRGEHEYLIPAVSEFLEAVDLEAGVVRVRLIEGMESDED